MPRQNIPLPDIDPAIAHAESGVMTDGQLHERLAQDPTDLDRWLKANAVFGAIIAVGFVAMAVIGSAGSRVTQSTVAISSTAEVASGQ